MAKYTLSSILLFIILAYNIQCSISINSDLRFTPQEVKALAEIKTAAKDLLLQNYQKLDAYLIHFLRSRDLNIKKTRIMLEENQSWRKSNKIDTILQEPEMLKMAKIFPHSFEQFDKEGRPVLTYALEKWDLRKVALAGQTQVQKYRRYEWYLQEKAARKVFDLALEGKNVSQYLQLIDLNGFNLRQHFCLPCTIGARDFARTLEERYPFMTYKAIIINIPRAFYTFIRTFRLEDILSPNQESAIKTFGFDKSEWRPYLAKLIDDDQLLVRYGGKLVGSI